MRHLFLVFFIVQSAFAQNNTVFDCSRSLRIDFNLLANAQRIEVIFQQLKSEPHWGGSHTHLVFPNLGNLRLQLFDGETLVFSKGFNSLADEWKEIEEAKTLLSRYANSFS